MTKVTTVDDILQHYGVKGMRWGVRKEKQLKLHEKVASGKGSALDTLRAVGNMKFKDIAASKGNLKTASGKRAQQLGDQKARVAAGQASLKDNIDLYRSLTLKEFGSTVKEAATPSKKKK